MMHEIDVEAHVLGNCLILLDSTMHNQAVYYPTIVVALQKHIQKGEIRSFFVIFLFIINSKEKTLSNDINHTSMDTTQNTINKQIKIIIQNT